MSLEEYDVEVSPSSVDHCHDTVVNIGLQRRVTNYALHEWKAELPDTARCHLDWSRLGIGGRV